jgi:hypothetical protein
MKGDVDMGDRRVLNYGDCLLRHADVQLLRGPNWLNDQVKEFNNTSRI